MPPWPLAAAMTDIHTRRGRKFPMAESSRTQSDDDILGFDEDLSDSFTNSLREGNDECFIKQRLLSNTRVLAATSSCLDTKSMEAHAALVISGIALSGCYILLLLQKSPMHLGLVAGCDRYYQ